MDSEKKKELLRMLKFTLFSISAAVVQIVSFTLLNELVFKEGYWIQYLISVTLSVVWNFTLNRNFTFKSANNIPIAMLKVFGFYCVFTPVSVILGEMAAQRFTADFVEYIILGVTMATNMVTEFLYCKYVVYNEKSENKGKENDRKEATK